MTTQAQTDAERAFYRIKNNFRGFCRCEPNELNALCTHCYDFRDIETALKQSAQVEGLAKALEYCSDEFNEGRAKVAREALAAWRGK